MKRTILASLAAAVVLSVIASVEASAKASFDSIDFRNSTLSGGPGQWSTPMHDQDPGGRTYRTAYTLLELLKDNYGAHQRPKRKGSSSLKANRSSAPLPRGASGSKQNPTRGKAPAK
jgi:hypothetical protein